MILLTGFGSFPGVSHNPSADLVRALHGRVLHGERVVSMVLPVSFTRGPDRTLALARLLRPRLVLGFGVAGRRTAALVEQRAVNRAVHRDVDGRTPADLGIGPAELRDDALAPALADALGLGLSEDAGAYVCNAWLYAALSRCPSPAAFVHIPQSGLDPELVAAGLTRWLARDGAPPKDTPPRA